ncbi:UDP-glucose 6-dehydrogenase [Anaerobacillus arseniciselenatis]|uniref:UDP-glucose 6-dehydrogenase n=1 Tax=Anaerobacillus arseniciselenatis TaxID=85682 RepID=A0A1S2LEF7_9BACI|nr:UDP-glucose/GDP-mannose dehydrogenase family protein [Anaerobacillus arseniciselenatis]OIJ10771.1 UDP-glucose 6-dehydrogenase [Anaerobacillus arseniciselenatis]
MITVIGLGFVGLTTALGFSEKGYRVYGYDIDEKKLNRFKAGEVPFYEPILDKTLQKHSNNNFMMVKNLEDAIKNSEMIFICVGTPSKEDGSVDLSYISEAIKNVLEKICKSQYKVIVIKSTVPPGTTEGIIKPFIESFGFEIGKNIGLTSNPEFLREGYAWEDFMKPDRIVIGEIDNKSGQLIENVYKVFNAPIYRVSLNTAEFIKYLSNTLLATLISYANEQSLIAKSIGSIDIKKAFHILHLDKRWFGEPAAMTSYVYPGCGFGGYCLPKDTKALIKRSKETSYSPKLLESTININESIKDFVVCDVVGKVNKNEKIGILGLAFKPNSDDVRDTPAKAIIQALINKGHKNIIAYDPLAMNNFQETYQLPIVSAASLTSLLSQVKYVVILTSWDEFIENTTIIKEKVVFDYRYLYDLKSSFC